MDIWTALRIIGRNWALAALGLLLTVAAVSTAAGRVEPEFAANAQLLMLSPTEVTDNDGDLVERNVLAQLGSTEGTFAGLLARVAQSQRFYRAALLAGAGKDFNIGSDQSAVVSVRVTAASSAEALRSQDILIKMLQDELAKLQDATGAPPGSFVTATPLDASIEAVPLYGDRNKVMVAVGLLGLALSCILAFGAEAIRTRSRRGAEPVRTPAGRGAAEPGLPIWREAVGAGPAARRRAIEAVAWSPPPDAQPFRLGDDAPPGGPDSGDGDHPGHDETSFLPAGTAPLEGRSSQHAGSNGNPGRKTGSSANGGPRNGAAGSSRPSPARPLPDH